MMVFATTQSSRLEDTYRVDTLRDMRRLRRWVRIGAPAPWLTPVSGMAAVTELVDRLGVIKFVGRGGRGNQGPWSGV